MENIEKFAMVSLKNICLFLVTIVTSVFQIPSNSLTNLNIITIIAPVIQFSYKYFSTNIRRHFWIFLFGAICTLRLQRQLHYRLHMLNISQACPNWFSEFLPNTIGEKLWSRAYLKTPKPHIRGFTISATSIGDSFSANYIVMAAGFLTLHPRKGCHMIFQKFTLQWHNIWYISLCIYNFKK